MIFGFGKKYPTAKTKLTFKVSENPQVKSLSWNLLVANF